MAIVGTAQSWRHAPWADPGTELWSMNDAYRLPGFQRADRWFDLHPVDHMWFVPKANKTPSVTDVPEGRFYARPEGYLEWLKALQIPLYLNGAPPEGFGPQAQPFPKAAIEAQFGRYFTSTPAWMLALAIAEGFTDISIYGIHLATESEYIEQRPNFEYLIGRVLGTGAMTTSIEGEMRHYRTAHGHVALPVASPVLNSDFQYAFDVRPRAALLPYQAELHTLGVKREKCIQRLAATPWWKSRSSTHAELKQLDAAIADTQQALQRIHYAIGG
jgi:hypothetical protein